MRAAFKNSRREARSPGHPSKHHKAIHNNINLCQPQSLIPAQGPSAWGAGGGTSVRYLSNLCKGTLLSDWEGSLSWGKERFPQPPVQASPGLWTWLGEDATPTLLQPSASLKCLPLG